MPEVDTARWRLAADLYGAGVEDIHALCDALDAARAERDAYKAMIRPENVWRARVVAALAELDPTVEDYEPYLRVKAARRALTGDA